MTKNFALALVGTLLMPTYGLFIAYLFCFIYFTPQAPLRGFLGNVPSDYHSYALITMVLLSTFLILMAKVPSIYYVITFN